AVQRASVAATRPSGTELKPSAAKPRGACSASSSSRRTSTASSANRGGAKAPRRGGLSKVRTQGSVHGSTGPEDTSHVGVENHDVSYLFQAARILPPNPARKIVFRPHPLLRAAPLRDSHSFSAHSAWRF